MEIKIRDYQKQDCPAILDIINDAILNSTALYDYNVRTLTTQEAIFEEKLQKGFPVIVAEMNGEVLGKLFDYFSLTKDAMTIVKITFVISLLYNVVGLTIAVMGEMSPLVAAILMPISSISVVAFTSLSTWLRSKKYFKIL
jgi:hypothetical protein